MNRAAILLALALSACTPAELERVSRTCDGIVAGVTSAEEIASRMAAAGIAREKIATLLPQVESGKVQLTAACAVVAAAKQVSG